MNGKKEVKVPMYSELVRMLVRRYLKNVLILLLRRVSPGKVGWSENPC